MSFQQIAAILTATVSAYALDSVNLNLLLKAMLVGAMTGAAYWIVEKLRSE